MHQARHRSATSAWLVRPRVLGGLAVGLAGLTLAIWLPTRSDVAEADDHGRDGAFRHAAFADDFTGRPDLDLTKWSARGAAQVDDGRLEVSRPLTARQHFTAKFGHAEARLRVSRASGVWRAFALVDGTGRLPEGTIEPIAGGIDPTSGDGFHTYVIDWTPETVTWTVDSKPTLRLVRAEPGPLTLVLNLDPGRHAPGRMTVDFVRVQTSDDGPPSATPSTPPPSEPPATASPTPTATPTATPSAEAWAAFTDYAAGDLVTFEGTTYRVREAHTSLPGWEPPKVPNLFAEV